jgi:hypothetical protein
LLVFLFSCEKLEKCKTCTTNTTCTGDYKTSVTFEACGSEIDDVDGKTITSTASVSGITVTCIAKTTCK